MSDFLETLEAVQVDPLIITRDKLIEDIELQKRAVAAELNGTPFKPKDQKRAFHTWHRLRKREWWTQLKAGHTALKLNGGVLFRAGKELADVIDFYDTAIPLIEAGELDDAIRDAMKRRERP
jgi:hypothetical protein